MEVDNSIETSSASTEPVQGDQTSEAVNTEVQSSKAENVDTTEKMQNATSKDGVVAAQVATPAYVPNYKFKAFDKEYEFEDAFKKLITNKEQEEAFRKIHAKAYALDETKEKFSKHTNEFQGYKQTVEPKLKTFDFLNKIVQNKDWDTFFTKLNVPDQEIFDYVAKKLEVLQAGPEQKAEYQRQAAIREQSYVQQNQLQEMQSMYQSQAVQTRTMQLESLLNRPDVSKYAVAWDESNGKVGAFRELVIDEAANHFYRTGKDLSTEEAINHVITRFGKVIPLQNQVQNQQTQDFTNQPGSPQAPKAVPVIPHVIGKGTSPVKKVPKSLDDLKAMAKELNG